MLFNIKSLCSSVHRTISNNRDVLIRARENGKELRISFVRNDSGRLNGFIINKETRVVFDDSELVKNQTVDKMMEIAISYLNNFLIAKRFMEHLKPLESGKVKPDITNMEVVGAYGELFVLGARDGLYVFSSIRGYIEQAYCTTNLELPSEVDRFRSTVKDIILTTNYVDPFNIPEEVELEDNIFESLGDFVISNGRLIKQPEEETIDDKEDMTVECTFCHERFPSLYAPAFNEEALSDVNICPECSVDMINGIVVSLHGKKKDFFNK